jgi:predicted permease
METILQDIRYGMRVLCKQPGFSVVAILTLAFGIGASTALFSVIDAALLRPLPFPHPEQLVSVRVLEPLDGRIRGLDPSISDARDWRAGSRAITAVGVARENLPQMVVDAGGGPERVAVNELSEGLLELYGATPILGRPIGRDDEAVGAPSVILLGYGYWRSRFGGDPNVVNRTVRFVEGPATIVGVLPATFFRKAAIWRPHPLNTTFWAPNRRGRGTDTFARLAAGVSLQDAERTLTELTQRLAAERGEPTNIKVQLKSLYSETTAGYSTTVNTLLGAVGFILLIACVNVAGLLLARGAARRPELAIRASIGAGRARLIRQLLTESLVLAFAGGSVGALFASASLDALVTIIPMSLPTESTATINLPVLAFTLALSVVTAVLFGLLPAFTLSRVTLTAGFGGGNRRHGSALSRRSGQWLIGIEVALAVVLLAGAGLLIRSFAHAMAADVGFDPSAVLTMEVTPIDQAPAVLNEYYPALLERIRSMPSVSAAGAVDYVPMGNVLSMSSAQADGRPAEMMVIRHALPGYVPAMGLRLKKGRVPSDTELAAGPTLVMINEEAAKRLFPNGPAVGRSVTLFKQPPAEVVAVAGNIRQSGPLWGAQPELSVLSTQPVTGPMVVVIRPAPGARVPIDQLREAALGVGPEVFLERIRTASELLGDQVVTPRRRTLLFSLLGGLGLLLTLVGIFGTTAYAVARRTQEIGIRMAFGARPDQVVRTIVSDAVWPVVIGIAIGLGGSMLSTKVIAKFLFQTTPTDPATFATVAIALGIAAGIAAWLPARRAARVNPVTALRAE